ncbi:hypothetical protein CAMGR0001_2463 [Campylobacter gracilis RM3268]|uniref:Uncharacterized protein n=1 Tax=Campylobacter gracilis RM3268 TaxID=553220 RepID=C8PEB0_9BACT|nr:hypothetical protein CAMGR0001_2463 [Campylobacter gracilis RM3268]
MKANNFYGINVQRRRQNLLYRSNQLKISILKCPRNRIL